MNERHDLNGEQELALRDAPFPPAIRARSAVPDDRRMERFAGEEEWVVPERRTSVMERYRRLAVAAVQGARGADEARANVARAMSKADLAEAMRLARETLARNR